MAREQFQTLTEPMYYILMALSEECCGVDIMERVRQISGGRVKVGPGTLYTMLSKFPYCGSSKNRLYYKKAAGEPPEKSKDWIERFFCGNRERTRNRSCSGSRTFGDETG